MGNSKLITCTVKSPNHSGKRTHSIDRITPHCVVGQLSASAIGGCFPQGRNASCNYGIGTEGGICLIVDEENRSWCSSSNANDQRAVTIECASDKTDPYAMNSTVYNKLIDLCEDICRRNGKTKLIWISNKDKALAYNPASNEMQLTVHRWFANKSCPGDWLFSRLGDVAKVVTERLAPVIAEVMGAYSGLEKKGEATKTGLQATDLKNLSDEQVIAKVGTLFTADQENTGILASVSLAQFILESGYGKSELAQNANNCFGMKKSLSGNTWGSIYTKQTKEQNPDGTYETITADFRKYPCVEDSVADHSAYLLGAKNGSELRYAGLKGCADYKKAIQIIKDGGYATSLTYVEKLCSIIEKWNLTQYDVRSGGDTDVMYRVQVGAYSKKENADNMLAKIKAKGFDAFITQVDGMYKVQVGAYSVKANADAQLKKIKDAGFGAFITTKSGTQVSSSIPTKKSNAEIAQEIYRGTCSDPRWSTWGNGDTRKERLKAAGYDYNAVQKEVSKLF